MGTGGIWHITAIDVFAKREMGSRFGIEKPGVGSRHAECGREAGERPLWTIKEAASRQERPLSRNIAFTRQNEIKAKSSAIKSEDSWSKFLQTLPKQRQSASLHHSTILMMAGNLLMFIPGSLCVPDIVNCLPSSSSLTPSSPPIGPSCSVKHNVAHYSDVGVPRPSCSLLPPSLSRHLQQL
jgi:hypothetical protein